MTPSLPDQAYQSYVDAVGASNNPLASWNTASYDVDQVPRGAHPIELYASHYGSGTSYAADGTATVVTGVLIDNSLKQALWVDAGGATGVAYTFYDQQWWVVEVKTKITEPLFISPFTWSSPEHNAQGLLGINNMAFNFSLDSTLSRLICDGTGLVTASATAGVTQAAVRSLSSGASNLNQSALFTDSNMLLKFLSTQPSDRLETKNVVPYMDFPRYLTNANSGQSIEPLGTSSVLSNNIQLNQIPDYFLVCVRKAMTSQTIQDADSFFRITGVSVNINNASGLLSSATAQDLWKMSMRNGSNQSWSEFSGEVWDNNSNDGEGGSVYTTGSLLVLSPPMDLSLPDYLTSGSLGNFNFQIKVNVENLSKDSIAPEVCVVCVNSGIFVTSQGVSSVYSGILTREMCLKTKAQSAESQLGEERLVGGKMLNRHPLRPMKGRAVGGSISGGAKSGGGNLQGMY